MAFAIAAVLGFGALGTPARAEFFDYTTSVTASLIAPTTGTLVAGTELFTSGTYTRSVPNVTYTGPNTNQLIFDGLDTNPLPPHLTASGGTGITFGAIHVGNVTPSPGGAVDSFSLNFTYVITLTDYATNSTPPGPGNPTGTVSVTGRVDASFGNGGGNGLISSLAFATPNIITLSNGQQYIFTALEADNIIGVGNNPSTVSALLIARPVPEPASLSLLAVGGLGAWRLARRKRITRNNQDTGVKEG